MKNRKTAWVLIIGGLAAFSYGVMNGDPGQVMLKGIRVCLECIGIG